MGKALIIGAGGVASVVIHKCCQNPDIFEEICIASRTLAKCDAIKDKLSGGRTKIQTAQLAADHTDEVIALINKFQPDIVINVALRASHNTLLGVTKGYISFINPPSNVLIAAAFFIKTHIHFPKLIYL